LAIDTARHNKFATTSIFETTEEIRF